MQTKKYLVTNPREGGIAILGRIRIDIPGLCTNYTLTLPETTAVDTIRRIKRQHPELSFKEAPAVEKVPEAKPVAKSVEKSVLIDTPSDSKKATAKAQA